MKNTKQKKESVISNGMKQSVTELNEMRNLFKLKTPSSVILSEAKNPFKSILIGFKNPGKILNKSWIPFFKGMTNSLLKPKNQKLQTIKQKPFSSSSSDFFFRPYIGFTLVELIVVITILAILGTIAFVSFSSYSSQSRDSTRVADINSLNKSLALFQLKSSKYPDPSGTLTTVAYSGGVLFTQGSLGDSVIKSIGSISKKPVDPLTQKEYTYSVNSNYTAYQIKADFENNSQSFNYNLNKNEVIANIINNNPFININKTFAANNGSTSCYIKGSFNGLIEKTNTGSTNYILALPGMITSDISSVVDYNTLSGKILCNGMNTPCNIAFNPTVVYSGNTMPTTSTQITQMMLKLQDAYTGSNITTLPQIKELLESTGTSLGSLGENIVKSDFNITVNNNDGICGSDNLKTLSITPTNLCSAGNPSPINTTGTGWVWSCDGINGSIINDSCSASKITPINGVCGSDDGKTLATTPTNLCTNGNPKNLTGTGPWSWYCEGINSGTDSYTCNSLLANGTQTNPGTTCKTILDTGSSFGSGLYWIKPNGVNVIKVYCDMSTNGGGRTILFNSSVPNDWKNDIGTPGTGNWSHNFSSININFTQLMLVRVITGQNKVVNGMNYSKLYICSKGSDFWWDGTKTNTRNALHLGISSDIGYGNPTNKGFAVTGASCNNDHQSRGFGHHGWMDDYQAYGWDSLDLGSTIFRIGVK